MGEVTVLLVHLKGLAVSESLPLGTRGKMKDFEFPFCSLKQYLVGIIAQAIDIFVTRRLDTDKYRDFFTTSFSVKQQQHIQSLIISLRKMCLFSTYIARTAQSRRGLCTDTLVANKDRCDSAK